MSPLLVLSRGSRCSPTAEGHPESTESSLRCFVKPPCCPARLLPEQYTPPLEVRAPSAASPTSSPLAHAPLLRCWHLPLAVTVLEAPAGERLARDVSPVDTQSCDPEVESPKPPDSGGLEPVASEPVHKQYISAQIRLLCIYEPHAHFCVQSKSRNRAGDPGNKTVCTPHACHAETVCAGSQSVA